MGGVSCATHAPPQVRTRRHVVRCILSVASCPFHLAAADKRQRDQPDAASERPPAAAPAAARTGASDARSGPERSVEGWISEALQPAARAAETKFQSAGREDADVRMLGNGRPFVIEFVRATAGPDPCLPSLAARVGVFSPAAVVSLSAVALPLLRAWPLRRSIVRTRATPSAARSIGAAGQSAARAWAALSPSTRRMRRSIRRLSRAGGGRSRGAAVRPSSPRLQLLRPLRACAPLRLMPARGTASVGQHARRCRRSEVPTFGGADGRCGG
jgi:hypothetical protein